jgi:predicted Zn-dependent peptidase
MRPPEEASVGNQTTIELGCGMPLVVERIESVASVALCWLLPLGSATDPPEADGRAAMLSELVFRGAGALESRAASDALDRLGVRRGAGTEPHHLRLSFTLLGEKLEEALPLAVAMVREPRLPEDAVEPVRSLCLQSLASLDDDPQHLVMLRLRERSLPPPFNRHGYGDAEALGRITGDELRAAWAAECRPGGALLTAAGAVDPDALAASLESLLGEWSGETKEPDEDGPAARGTLHLEQETSQVHIGLSFPAPPEPHPDATIERLLVAILSGGTSARLFSEVRQKRSLCYSVGASYRSGRDRGLVTVYAGTTPERAQETLDVCLAEIDRMRAGASKEEFQRAVTGLKSRLVMQSESTRGRAAGLAADHFRLGRARTLDELTAAIDAITLEELNAYAARRVFDDATLASIGPKPLRI